MRSLAVLQNGQSSSSQHDHTPQLRSPQVTNQEQLLALAERCEKAAGPDRDLDEAIALIFGWRLVAKGWVRDPGGNSKDELPRFTASLDAAMTLVPAGGRRIEFGTYGDGG